MKSMFDVVRNVGFTSRHHHPQNSLAVTSRDFTSGWIFGCQNVPDPCSLNSSVRVFFSAFFGHTLQRNVGKHRPPLCQNYEGKIYSGVLVE